jgi:hypothetical protein
MSARIVIGIDPGLTGALCFLADGVPVFRDMPCVDFKDRQRVDGHAIAAELRGYRGMFAGAHFFAATEIPFCRQGESGMAGQRSGINYGIVLGVLDSLGIARIEVTPQKWKKHHALLKTEKDVARQVAMQRFPDYGVWLQRKKDNGRADALWIALWAHETEAWL